MPQSFTSSGIAIQSDGRILVARSTSGVGGTTKSVLRFNADGTTDATFDAPGVGTIKAIAAAPDGTVYIGGSLITFQSPNIVFKPFLHLNADCSVDYPFNPFVASPDDAPLMSNAIAQPDGKVLVRGAFQSVNRQARSSLARLNSDGTLDPTFTLAANVSITDGTHSDNALVLQPDGKILVNGRISGGANYNVIRLNADGSLDTSFNVAGGADLGINKIALQPDGKILVGGSFTAIGGQTRNSVARLNADGSIDGFQPNFASPNMFVTSLLVQPDGKFLVTGTFSSVNGTPRSANVRFNADGTIDATFANTNLGGGSPYLAIQPDGKLIVEEGGYVVRVNANNTPDNSFTPLTVYVTTNNQGNVNTAAVQSDGKILLGGNFHFNGGYSRILPNIVRLNTNGSIDTTYINYGGASGNFNAGAGGGTVQQISLQPDGKVLLAGYFKTFNNFGRFGIARLNQSVAQTNRIADFDGDGRADASVFRSGTWYINPSASNPNFAPSGFYGVQFGLATDKLAPADYDGDGKTDIAVWREGSLSYFYVLQSSNNTFRPIQFGTTGDNPAMVGDWDGDGKADAAVYRGGAAGNFYYRPSSQPTVDFVTLQWGTAGDLPMRGDFDGDGKADAAVFRPSNNTWYIRQSSNNQLRADNWGTASDKFVTGDYDGDGKTDLAVFRSGVWYIKQSSDNQAVYRNWGVGSDTLVPADYDGDGKTDVAVYRSGVYYILNSGSAATYVNFGAAGDVPIASAFVQ